MFQCHQKTNLACCHMPKLYLCWHKSVLIPFDLCHFFFLFFFLFFRMVLVFASCSPEHGNWVDNATYVWVFNNERLSCASGGNFGLNSGTKPGWVACVLNLFANRSRAQSVDVTPVRHIHQHLRLLSSHPSTFSLSFLMRLPHTQT